VHTDALYALRKSGQVVGLNRGLYRLAVKPNIPALLSSPHVRRTQLCLISALSYHEITTQIPSSVYLAAPRGSYHGIRLPTPVSVYRFDAKTFQEVAQEIKKDSEYMGTRILLDARMNNVRLRIQIDFGRNNLGVTDDRSGFSTFRGQKRPQSHPVERPRKVRTESSSCSNLKRPRLLRLPEVIQRVGI
jgi:hypothetical protein